METMASTNNAEILVKITRIVNKLCDYKTLELFFSKREFAGSGLFLQIWSQISFLLSPTASR